MNINALFRAWTKHRHWLRPAWGAILGGLLGFLLLHPYVMLLGTMGVDLPHWPPPIGTWNFQDYIALDGPMVAMAAPLAIFGAVTGLLAGFYFNRTHNLHQLTLEQRQSDASLEAVRALTATLSHYLLNANMIIGGKVRHCRRLDPPQDILESLVVIEEQGRTIDAVIGTLRDVARIVMERGAPNQIPMIDLSRELEERLRRTESQTTETDDAIGSPSDRAT